MADDIKMPEPDLPESSLAAQQLMVWHCHCCGSGHYCGSGLILAWELPYGLGVAKSKLK